MLYFFHGREAVVVANGFIKKAARVHPAEIERAQIWRARFLADPELRSFHWESAND